MFAVNFEMIQAQHLGSAWFYGEPVAQYCICVVRSGRLDLVRRRLQGWENCKKILLCPVPSVNIMVRQNAHILTKVYADNQQPPGLMSGI